MPRHNQTRGGPKKVVYLWGAGATQAEINYLGAHSVNLLMRDNEELGEGIATRILRRLPKKWRTSFNADQGLDIEKLISLLVAGNVDRYSKLADTIRRLYFEDICESLTTAEILRNPQLAVGLLSMHANDDFKRLEVLSGIITTNHDGLLQLASQRVFSEVNLGIPFISDDLGQATPANNCLLLHLHGSFTWTFHLPMKVALLSPGQEYSRDTVWIPPTILKESKSYPFNKLAGMAYELLSKHCDVLRVVGSALTQNDWNVLSMIFNAQRHSELTKGVPFRVELIMPHPAGQAITRDCSYLEGLTPIGFLTEGDFAGYKEEDQAALTAEMKNPLAYWMKETIQFHTKRGDFGSGVLNESIARISGEIP